MFLVCLPLTQRNTILISIPDCYSEGYLKTLRALLPFFPLTQRDLASQGRRAVLRAKAFPYKLVANPGVLNSLVTGRRKAIEVCTLPSRDYFSVVNQTRL